MAKLKETLTSRKFLVYLGAVLKIMADDAAPGFFSLSEASLKLVVYASIAYMTAQGVADHGKEAVKEKAKAGEIGL